MPFASTILMVRPAAFAFNEETAGNNAFQQRVSFKYLQIKVLNEFDEMARSIRSAGIDVIVVEDSIDPPKPDAVFPNNWFCTLPGGTVATFPMFAANRRMERRKDLLEMLMHQFSITEIEDWTLYETHQQFLEGTGSMVMDHENKIIYACLSERTHPLLLHKFSDRIGYETVSFNATDKNGLPVYHTNVMMCVGHDFCVLCDEMIDRADVEAVKTSLANSGKKHINIQYKQVWQFAGNMLQLQNKNGKHLLVMSRSAFDSLNDEQKMELQKHTSLLPVNIPTIESVGGGSARCMMAEIFLSPH